MLSAILGTLCVLLLFLLCMYFRRYTQEVTKGAVESVNCQNIANENVQAINMLNDQLQYYRQQEQQEQQIASRYKPSGTTTCYGTSDRACYSCNDVLNGFRSKKMSFDLLNIDQCNEDNSQYAQYCFDLTNNQCRSCTDVLISLKKLTGKDLRDIDVSMAPQCALSKTLMQKFQ